MERRFKKFQNLLIHMRKCCPDKVPAALEDPNLQPCAVEEERAMVLTAETVHRRMQQEKFLAETVSTAAYGLGPFRIPMGTPAWKHGRLSKGGHRRWMRGHTCPFPVFEWLQCRAANLHLESRATCAGGPWHRYKDCIFTLEHASVSGTAPSRSTGLGYLGSEEYCG